MCISVLGAGSWGTTLAILLNDNQHNVTLWTYKQEHADLINTHHENRQFLKGIKIPVEIEVTHDLQEAVKTVDGSASSELIVVAVPVQYIRTMFKNLQSVNLSKSIVVSVAKGIEVDTLMTVSRIILDISPSVDERNIAVISGPSHAEEVARNIPTAVVAASGNEDTGRRVQETFLRPNFRVYQNEDILGVELGGALKNVIAIAAGISDGIGFGDNTKAALMTRGIAEITRLGVAMGAEPKSFAGLSGVGDLFVTCMSKFSRNRYVGEQIGKGRKLDDILSEMVMVAEGVETTRSVRDLARTYNVEMPISLEVYNMLFEGKDPSQATEDLMTRDVADEVR